MIKNSKEHCGEPQFASTFIYTVLPNFTIFCLIMLLLFVFHVQAGAGFEKYFDSYGGIFLAVSQ